MPNWVAMVTKPLVSMPVVGLALSSLGYFQQLPGDQGLFL